MKLVKLICPNCGAEIDRDNNAALNILHEGKRILSGCGAHSDDKQKCGEASRCRVYEPRYCVLCAIVHNWQ